MRDRAARSAAPRRSIGAGELASYGLIIGAVVLGWQIAIQPLIQRAPVELAVRLAPGSPMVLSRAAEAELVAGRNDNAAALSRDALVRSPFDVRALRVLGLTEARAQREDAADDILTLAGNWSLRDDPAHAWLVERRLRRGDYASAFAHADTLVRRRRDIQPQVFRLFTVAGTEDPQRALPVIARLLTAKPPWRGEYLGTLSQTNQELGVFASLAVLLEAGRAPLVNDELARLYTILLHRGQFSAISALRGRINRPPAGITVTDGGFDEPAAPEPFQWRFLQKAGIAAEVVADDLRPTNLALRVDYDGYATGTVAQQLTSLPAGAYRFDAAVRTEAGNPRARLAWTLTCATGGSALASLPAGAPSDAPSSWTGMSGRFQVPTNCPAQWLKLETRASDRRDPTVVWFDGIKLVPTG